MNKLPVVYRYFSTCSFALGKCADREARVMNKFIGSPSKKRSWYPAKDVSATSLPHIVQPKRGDRNSRRISVLNKVFMKYVSDLLTTGELIPDVNHLAIEISKVRITPDFAVLNVYWVARGTNTDEKVESVLSKNARKLRHELTQLRVIGNVPAIQFVKDKTMSQVAEVDAILAKADFGDDFEPTDPAFSLLSNLTLSTKLPKHLEEKILSQDGGLPDIPVPSMQSASLGLQHDVIMQKIQLSMNKAKAPHRNPNHSPDVELNSDEISLTRLKGEDSVEDCGTEMNVQNADLRKFFAKRMALQSKVLKPPKNYEPGKEILEQSQEDLLDDEEDLYEIDISANAQRIKELEIHIDDFEGIEDDYKHLIYQDENLNK